MSTCNLVKSRYQTYPPLRNFPMIFLSPLSFIFCLKESTAGTFTFTLSMVTGIITIIRMWIHK